jgi:type IV secretion system protein VirD4
MASEEEIKKASHRIAFNEANPEFGGIPLYSDDGAVYVEDKDAHTIIAGSTGSKKSRLIAMPALQIYAMAGESFVANDPKGELYKKTYQTLKKRGYKINVLNLRNPTRSNSWNPLQIPYTQYHSGQRDKAVEFVRDIADSIAKNGHSLNDPYWENCAANVLAGLILILFEHAKSNEIHFKSLRALRTQAFQIAHNEVPYIQYNYLRHIDKSSFLHSFLSGTAEVTESTRSCIISVFDQALMPFFCQDNLVNMLSGNDIDLGGIGQTKTAVFLIVPDEHTVYNKLISLYVKQCYNELLHAAEKHPGNRLPVRVNFLLDEFLNLPAINDFSSMITASRSRNIRFNLFIQGLNQLVERYGHHAETIKGNCENWIYLHSREPRLLDELIGLAGRRNFEQQLVSVSTLQTLDKEKGEAFILHNRLYPYIARLLDIDEYPFVPAETDNVPYPENTYKADAVFDFKKHCESIEANYMASGDFITEPIFTSEMPADNSLEEADEELEEEENEKTEEEPSSKVTLERYGSSVGCGWYGLLAPILDEINLYNGENKKNEIEIDQIKEKFGTLNIYTTGCPDYIKGMISLAEEESGHVCEICGARGETVKINGWYTTLCHRHAKAKKAAGYDTSLLLKLYRKLMETYEYSRWSRTNDPVIKRLLRKNWFITRNRDKGILRTIKLERENQRTNFYVKIGKEYKKHGLYVQWSENDEKTLLDGYWHVMERNEKESCGMIERQTAEKEAVNKIYSSWGKRLNMKFLRMVSFEEGQAFPQCSVQDHHDEYWKFVKEHLVKNNIKMTGAEHQKYGVPLIEDNGNIHAFTLSYGNWGKLMAEAFDPDNKDKSAYLKWSGKRPEGEASWVNPDME